MLPQRRPSTASAARALTAHVPAELDAFESKLAALKKTAAAASATERPQSAVSTTSSARYSRPTSAHATAVASLPASPSVDSLHHEIWLLRQSLEEERGLRLSTVSDEQARVTKLLEDQQAVLATALAARATAEKDAAAQREALRVKTESYALSLSRLQLQLSEYESKSSANQAASITSEQEALFALRWAESEKLRDRQEKERWVLHKKSAEETTSALQRTTQELEEARREVDRLRHEKEQERLTAERAAASLIAHQDALESQRAAREAQAAREQSNRSRFEESLALKKKSLEKEVKSKEEAASAASAALKEAAEEAQKLRRQIAALEEELKETRGREASRAKEWLAQSQAAAQMGRDVARSEEARVEAQKLLASRTQAHEESSAQLSASLSSTAAEAKELRAKLSASDAALGEARARIEFLLAQLASLQSDVGNRKGDQNALRSRVLQLESELATLTQTHAQTTSRLADLTTSSSDELALLRAQVSDQQVVIRGLEGMAQSLQIPLAAGSPTSGARTPTALGSPSKNSSASNLLSSPSSRQSLLGSTTTGAAGSRPTTPTAVSKQQARDDAARREVEKEALALRASQAALEKSSEDAARQAAILAQQRADLAAEQALLQTAASLLHSQLLQQLQSLLPLNFAAVSALAAGPLPGLTLVGVDELREQVREATETTDAIEQNLTQEIQKPATKLHVATSVPRKQRGKRPTRACMRMHRQTDCDVCLIVALLAGCVVRLCLRSLSLSERLSALRRACEFHEQRLSGLSPSKPANVDTSADNAAIRRTLFTATASSPHSTLALSPQKVR